MTEMNPSDMQQSAPVDSNAMPAGPNMMAQPQQIVNVNQGMQLQATTKSINKHVFTWVATFLVGGLGVDRFMRGQVGLGIVKLLFGWLTLGIWPLVDWIVAISKSYGNAFGDTEELVFVNGKYAR